MAKKDDELITPSLAPLLDAVNKNLPPATAGAQAYIDQRNQPSGMSFSDMAQGILKKTSDLIGKANIVGEMPTYDTSGPANATKPISPAVQKIIGTIPGRIVPQAQAATAPLIPAEKPKTVAQPVSAGNAVTPAKEGGHLTYFNISPERQAEIDQARKDRESYKGNYNQGSNPYDNLLKDLTDQIRSFSIPTGGLKSDKTAAVARLNALSGLAEKITGLTSFGAYGTEANKLAATKEIQAGTLAEQSRYHDILQAHYDAQGKLEAKRIGIEEKKLDDLLKNPKYLQLAESLITEETSDEMGNKIKKINLERLPVAAKIAKAFSEGNLEELSGLVGGVASKKALSVTRDEAFKRFKAKNPDTSDADIYAEIDKKYTFAGGK